MIYFMKMKIIFFYISDLIIETKYRANDVLRVIFLSILFLSLFSFSLYSLSFLSIFFLLVPFLRMWNEKREILQSIYICMFIVTHRKYEMINNGIIKILIKSWINDRDKIVQAWCRILNVINESHKKNSNNCDFNNHII